MTRLLTLFLGIGTGALVGVAAMTLLAPTAGARLSARFKAYYLDAMNSAREAAAQRRMELEAELKKMQQDR